MKGTQAGKAPPVARPAQQRLATPEGAVLAIADAVPGKHQATILDAALGGDRARMRFVMQHGLYWPILSPGPAMRRVARMRIANDTFRLHAV